MTRPVSPAISEFALREQRDELLAVLAAVHAETSGNVRPFSMDSYLPDHIFKQVDAAIARAKGVSA